MKELHRFDLSQLSEFFKSFSMSPSDDGEEKEREQWVSDYIYDHLLVARNPPIAQLMEILSSDTYILPEMRVMVITCGEAFPIVNLTPRHFKAGDVVFLSQNSIVQPQNYTEDVKGFGVSITDEVMNLVFSSGMPKMFDGHVRDCVFAPAEEEIVQVETIHTLLYDVTHHRRSPLQVVLHLVAAFLWQVDALWSKYEGENRSALSREQRLFTDFIQLVSSYATQEHTLDFYARRLFLSPRYMSALVKQTSGKAAKQWIDDAIVARIKVELIHGDKSAAQIADEMNFPNPSFFSKFFKRLTGMSPQAYREARRGQ